MSKNLKFIITLGVILVLAIIISYLYYYFTCDLDKSLTVFYNFFGLFTGTVTLYFAWILADKYAVGKKYSEKELDLVIDLVDHLNKLTLTYEFWIKDKSERFPEGKLQLMYDRKVFSTLPEKFKNLNLYLYTNDFIMGTSDISKFINNPWLPESIRTNLKFVQFEIARGQFPEQLKDINYGVLTFLKNTKTDLKSGKDLVSINSFETWNDFNSHINDLYISIEKWMLDYTGREMELFSRENNPLGDLT